MVWDGESYRPLPARSRRRVWVDRLLVVLVIVGTVAALGWGARVGAVRECRAAVESGSWEGSC